MVTIKSNGASLTALPVDLPPVSHFPSAQSADAIGDDFNIPLLVRESGTRQLTRMRARLSNLQTEVQSLEAKIQHLEQLVAIAEQV
jgi:TolA-binding protein